MAHGKTINVTADFLTDDLESESAKYPEPKWKKLCTLKAISRMVKDAEDMVRDLGVQTGMERNPFASLGGGWSGATLVLDDEVDVRK